MNNSFKRYGLILASLIGLSFNSHFAQAARKTTEAFKPGRAWAYKRVEHGFVPLEEVKPEEVVIKKTRVKIDRKNIYIGGYLINTTERVISHLKIYPTFADASLNNTDLAKVFVHEEHFLEPGETRRFVIMREISEAKELLANNIPVDENCVLNVHEVEPVHSQ